MTRMVRIRRKVENRLATLRDRVHRIEDDLGRRRNPPGRSPGDRAAVIENDDVLEALARDGRRQIRSLEETLDRIHSGAHGKCVTCGGPISPDRLAALPFTDRCVDCARAAEMN
jgi:RNA polymerase-binding transcription factor DksA